MISLDLKARLKNKYTWISFISGLILLSQQLGFDISPYLPKNYEGAVNSIFLLLGLLGVIVDTSTPGLSDVIVTEPVVVATPEAVTISTNPISIVTDATAAVTVDNPDNIPTIGAEVTVTTATIPQ